VPKTECLFCLCTSFIAEDNTNIQKGEIMNQGNHEGDSKPTSTSTQVFARDLCLGDLVDVVGLGRNICATVMSVDRGRSGMMAGLTKVVLSNRAELLMASDELVTVLNRRVDYAHYSDAFEYFGSLHKTPKAPEKLLTRPDWDTYFLQIADVVSNRADCRRRKVGCVIVDQHHRIISTGYNGAPAGDEGCLAGGCPRGRLSYDEVAAFTDYDTGPGRCISLHAEANALLYAGKDVRGATAYVTAAPCPTCAKLLRGAGIEKVVVVKDA